MTLDQPTLHGVRITQELCAGRQMNDRSQHIATPAPLVRSAESRLHLVLRLSFPLLLVTFDSPLLSLYFVLVFHFYWAQVLQ